MDVTDRRDDADDPESADAGSLDLTPRDTQPARPRGSGRRVVWWAAGVLVVAAIGVVATGLAGATTYFYNVDAAIEKRSEIGDRRVRLQGNIIKGSVRQTDLGVDFTLAYGGESVRVKHRGDVPDLFGPSIPVVIEGKFDGDAFRSDRVLVKHDETYDEKNSGRIRDAERDVERNASSTTVPAP